MILIKVVDIINKI